MSDQSHINKSSQDLLEFADLLRHRTSGNADDQAWCVGSPNRNYEFGVIFSEYEARKSRRGARTDIRPNALSVRFEVKTEGDIDLELIPSFWLYFRNNNEQNIAENAVDLWREDVVWLPWIDRATPINLSSGPPPVDETQSVYIRTRYCNKWKLRLSTEVASTQTIDLDLEQYRASKAELGTSPNWTGQLQIVVSPLSTGLTSIRIRLINTYSRRFTETAWFDVRMRIKPNKDLHETFCPLLESTVPVQTVNCVLVSGQRETATNIVEVEQINLGLRFRQLMRSAFSFEDSDLGHLSSLVTTIKDEATSEHSTLLTSAFQEVLKNQAAKDAIEIVFETFRRAMAARTPGSFWYRHQIAIFIIGIGEYLTGSQGLRPLVLNIPTAGGKTEAFTALALWTVAYETLRDSLVWSTAIVKYPTKLLSSDQAERLSHYVMHFEEVLLERIAGLKGYRGLGLFFGSDSDEIDRLEIIGDLCPQCGLPRSIQSSKSGRPQIVTCANRHSITIALQDEIYPKPPILIVSTIDKFVSKARKTEMGLLLGRTPIYWCESQRDYVSKAVCFKNNRVDHEHQVAPYRSKLTILVLDEAHLLREETGSLDAHFESHYLETAKELSGRYPLAVVSTATIAQAEEHCRQLGLDSPILFPSKTRENHSVYYEQDFTQIQHAVLSFMPRGRAIAWALPRVFTEYMKLHEGDTSKRWNSLKPTIIYCGSYATRNQTLNSIKRHVDPQLSQPTAVEEFSRRRFDQAGMRNSVANLASKDVIVSTNIASVGIDLGSLNAIMYFGMPYNVNEFIQSMNRTGRREPSLVCIVHNPYLERDAAFYSYMNSFLSRPEQLVEAVPLNRYARRAIDLTFGTISVAQLQNIWADKMPKEVDLRRARAHGYGEYRKKGFREAAGNELVLADVDSLLQKTYRSSYDPSRAYPDIVSRHWNGMANAISNYSPQGRGRPDFPYKDNWIWYADGMPETMWQLRIPEPTGQIEYSKEAQQLLNSNIKTIYASEKDEFENQRDEETDLRDGALKDTAPEGDDPGD